MSDACHFQVTDIECSLKQYLSVYICINLTNLEYIEKTCDFEVEFGIHVGRCTITVHKIHHGTGKAMEK